ERFLFRLRFYSASIRGAIRASTQRLYAAAKRAENLGRPSRRDSRGNPNSNEEDYQTNQAADGVPRHFKERRSQPEQGEPPKQRGKVHFRRLGMRLFRLSRDRLQFALFVLKLLPLTLNLPLMVAGIVNHDGNGGDRDRC